MQAYQKGRLISWNDNRGFGFIEPESKVKKVFLHISSLKKNGRRPQRGDIIYYQINFDRQKRVQAANAYIEGVQYQTSTSSSRASRNTLKVSHSLTPHPSRAQKNISRNHYRILSFFISIAILIAGIYSFSKHQKYSPLQESKPIQPSIQSKKYRCEGKTRCSEMTSCEEAMFYLENCPGVEIDGDGDGIPCEGQWCGN